MTYEDWEDEDWIEDDGGDCDDVLACPTCERLVHEDTQQCPHCGDWITPIDPSHRTKKLLVSVVVVLLILSFVLMALF